MPVNATRRFWIVSSLIGIVVCGAMALLYADLGLWGETTLFGVCTVCNIYTYRKYSKKAES